MQATALLLAVAISVVAFVLPTLRLMMATANGFTCKVKCSAYYVSGRHHDDMLKAEFRGVLGYINAQHDPNEKSFTCSTLDFLVSSSRKAVFTEGLGCALTDSRDHLMHRPFDGKPVLSPRQTRQRPWPTGDVIDSQQLEDVMKSVDAELLNDAVEKAFAEKENASARELRNTRGVAVIFKGQLIAERYGPNITASTALAGWSMCKSILNALVGVRVAQGGLKLSDTISAPEWNAARDGNNDHADDESTNADGRNQITVGDLLRMSSGLSFDEHYHPFIPKDPSIMLATQPSAASYAASKELIRKPNTFWYYSSGDSNLLSRRLRQSFKSYDEYVTFPRRFLFDKIGMESAVLETDAVGDFVASSFDFATLRDWARFGLLYQNDGVWEGERILPEHWVTETRTAVPAANGMQRYGMHWWLFGACPHHNKQNSLRKFPRAPCDTFSASGYEGQFVTVIPSHQLVIVRLGCTKMEDTVDIEDLIEAVVAAVSTKKE